VVVRKVSDSQYNMPLLQIFIAIIIASSVFGVKVSAQTEAETDVVKQLLELDLEDLMKVRIVTIATGAKQTVTKAPATTNVITAEEIEALGANDLDEVLETLPGLHINSKRRVGNGFIIAHQIL
jgi:outer membrane receptor for ferrienterochelin and colicin